MLIILNSNRPRNQNSDGLSNRLHRLYRTPRRSAMQLAELNASMVVLIITTMYLRMADLLVVRAVVEVFLVNFGGL